MPFVPDRLSLLPQACFRTPPGIGSISGHDRADTGQGWRISLAKMACIPGGGVVWVCEPVSVRAVNGLPSFCIPMGIALSLS